MNLLIMKPELEQEGIKLGQDYPKPLVDHKEEEIMLCQYLNKYKNNWSEIAIKLNVVSLQFTFVRREWGRNNIFQNLFYPSLLLVDFLVENLFAGAPLNYVLLSILELLT